MKQPTRILGAAIASALLALGASMSAPAQSLPLSPLSTGALAAQAFRAGLLQPIGGAPVSSEAQSNVLTCSPAPCVLPNLQASEGGQPVNEDPIIANPRNGMQLLTGGNDYNCTSSLQGFYASSDGGSTWNHTCLPLISGSFGGDGDPSVAYDLRGHTFAGGLQFDSSGNLDTVVARSINNGTTWAPPVIAVRPVISGGSTDKDWMQVDTTPTSPFANAIYVSNTQFDASSDSEISVAHSTNGGGTWTTVVVDTLQIYPSSVDQFSDLAIGKNGEVYVTWQRCPATGTKGDCGGTKATMMFSKSTDGGNTWSTPVVMATVQLVPDNCSCAFYGSLPNTNERVANIPVVDIDNSSGAHAGTLYAVMYNWTGTQMQVQVVKSTNDGATWSTPVRTGSSNTGDEFFQWLNVSAQGLVGVSWLDRRNDPSNISYEAYAAISLNGGASYGTNQQLTTSPSNPLKDGFSGGFMGDYTGNSWHGKTLFVSWMDSSNGVNMQDHVGGFIQ